MASAFSNASLTPRARKLALRLGFNPTNFSNLIDFYKFPFFNSPTAKSTALAVNAM